MHYHGRAKEAAQAIIKAFQSGNLPQPLAQVFITQNIPQAKWSISNQLVCVLQGCTDARGFRQWQQVGRRVIKGERARAVITAPLTKKEDKNDPDSQIIVYGFRGIPVFDISQTEGEDLPEAVAERTFLQGLPLKSVAEVFGLQVQTHDGRSGALGAYAIRQKQISLGVENLSTWLHELVHAADDRLGNLQESGQHWRAECVAELGGATLAVMLGQETAADVGGAWEYVEAYAKAADIEPITACTRILDRLAQAVSLILETADQAM